MRNVTGRDRKDPRPKIPMEATWFGDMQGPELTAFQAKGSSLALGFRTYSAMSARRFAVSSPYWSPMKANMRSIPADTPEDYVITVLVTVDSLLGLLRHGQS